MGFGLVCLYEILTVAPAHSEDLHTGFCGYTSNYPLVATGKSQWYSRQIPQILAHKSTARVQCQKSTYLSNLEINPEIRLCSQCRFKAGLNSNENIAF